MRTCASCGKANNPIRKYCTRCGKPLISVTDDAPSPTPTSVITETQIPDVHTPASTPKDGYVRSDTAKPTTDDQWVRPSQVSRDRVRSTSPSSGKSEMEKAKEAFARAEGVGIEEPDGSGVVETRMLRASEVRELMGEAAVITRDTAPPVQPTPPQSPLPHPAASVTPPTPSPVIASPSPAPQPAPTPHPTASITPPTSGPPGISSRPVTQPASSVTPSMPPGAVPTTQPAPTSTSPPITTAPAVNKHEPTTIPPPLAATPTPAAPTSVPVRPPTPAPIITSRSSIDLDARVPEIEEILSHVTEPEDLQDSKIKDLVASLTTQHAELRKVKEDLANVSSRLDEFVRSCQNDAEVKRIHYESLCDQERFAKQEYESAKKEYERVDKRRKKEIAGLEGKVKNVEKNISKSEDDVKKRIDELDRVREKIAQLQGDGS
ncbi:hypothetical protein EU528_07805 [Candidatus Thorarchaeota archaeon]|nr:MAG: hypothetical protein EU528_07805 [Candidatus Thorarchaeota archaeon]